MATKNMILKAKIEGVITELMVKTDVNNVCVDENTTLASKLASIIADIATKASATDLTTAIDALRQEMLGDTPVEAYNTFTELAAYISEHQEVSDALSAAVGNKADKTSLESYETSNDARVDALEANTHTHANKNALDCITAEHLSTWNTKSKVYITADEPSAMSDRDLWCQIV